MSHAIGYAAKHAHSKLRPMDIERRDPAANEVSIAIEFCGVCHSDVHQVRNEWKNTVYPCMPGHEIVGKVTQVGDRVQNFAVGDRVGVGCMVDSCGECASCREGLEQYCERGFLGTYNGNMRSPSEKNHTYGGYSSSIVVREDFVIGIPANLDPAAAAPLLCAGITTYSPLRHWKVGPGSTVGVVGFGGLGQMAIKLARAMGAEVTVITTSPDKGGDARLLGAATVVCSKDKASMAANAGRLDFMLSTIPQAHDANVYMPLLKRDGTYTVVGCLMPLSAPLDLSAMISDRKKLGTSLIGGIAETKEVLAFCSEHDIVSDIQLISVDEVNIAFDEIDKGEIDFRYVIDMSTLKGKQADHSLLATIGL